MLCLISLVVFSFLGIFFTEYRGLAREALDCLVSRLKTGDCEADFETRIRSSVIGRAMNHDRRLARFLNHHLEKITWLLLVIMIVAGIYVAIGTYNFVVYGNCNGPNAVQGCTASTLGSLDLGYLNPFHSPGNYSGVP